MRLVTRREKENSGLQRAPPQNLIAVATVCVNIEEVKCKMSSGNCRLEIFFGNSINLSKAAIKNSGSKGMPTRHKDGGFDINDNFKVQTLTVMTCLTRGRSLHRYEC